MDKRRRQKEKQKVFELIENEKKKNIKKQWDATKEVFVWGWEGFVILNDFIKREEAFQINDRSQSHQVEDSGQT